MNLQQLLFDDTVDQVSLVEDCGSNDLTFATFGGEDINLAAISSGKGALCGATLNPIKRIGDTENTISVATAGAYISRAIIKEGMPYYRQTVEGVFSVYPTYHFLLELRRQLSGCAAVSEFSHEEAKFYKDYRDWSMGKQQYGELLLAVQTLDEWLIDELVGNNHPDLEREYTTNHPWMKLEERE